MLKIKQLEFPRFFLRGNESFQAWKRAFPNEETRVS